MNNILLEIGKLEDGSLKLEQSAYIVGSVIEQALRQVAHLASQKKNPLS